MTEAEEIKSTEGQAWPVIQVQTGDIEVAKLQLAARWAEMATQTEVAKVDLEEWLKAFNRAYKAIDEALRV